MARASIAIFPKKIEYTDSRPSPDTPSEVFEAAQRIIEAKDGCELVRSRSGLYIVAYSETGPSNCPEGWDGWLPVYVAKVVEWAAGGIRVQEMEDFMTEKDNENEA
jgi:hypothetical protein